jgi:hypothetical protein
MMILSGNYRWPDAYISIGGVGCDGAFLCRRRSQAAAIGPLAPKPDSLQTTHFQSPAALLCLRSGMIAFKSASESLNDGKWARSRQRLAATCAATSLRNR